MIRAVIASLLDFLQATLNIFLLIIFILFLPWLFLWYMEIHEHEPEIPHNQDPFKLGVEMVSPEFLKGLSKNHNIPTSIGLITNQAGTDQHGNRTLDILRKKGAPIAKLFVPPHSFHATSATEKNKDNPIPIISLYNPDGTKNLNEKNVESIDTLIFDLQDVGIRYYGYAVILLEAMYTAARFNKIIVILDRPNLLGSGMEGAFSTAVDHTNTIKPIPLRHGLTIGELARYYNTHILTKPAKLYVVPMQNYQRTLSQDNLVMENISPNIGSINSCYGYSFLGLLGEIAPFDVGIGTDKAFQCLTLPETIFFPPEKWKELSTHLEPLGIESTFYRYWSKRKEQYYNGLRFFIHDINNFSACKVLLTVVSFFKQQGISFSFSPNFDKVIGTNALQELLVGSIQQEQTIKEELNSNIQLFFTKAQNIFLYKPFPQPVIL